MSDERFSEFERAMLDRLSISELFMVLTALETGAAENVRDALREVREYQERAKG